MLSVWNTPTKKALKGKVGMDAGAIFQETSMFGPEYKGDGSYAVVGPSPTERWWYATVTVRSGKIVKVS